MPKQFLMFCLLTCFFLLSACTANTSSGNASKQPSSAMEENSIVRLVDATEEVQSLYASRCLNCHAIDLSGKMGEPTNLQKVHERLTYDELLHTITYGRELMPAFEERLNEDEIVELARWLSKQ